MCLRRNAFWKSTVAFCPGQANWLVGVVPEGSSHIRKCWVAKKCQAKVGLGKLQAQTWAVRCASAQRQFMYIRILTRLLEIFWEWSSFWCMQVPHTGGILIWMSAYVAIFWANANSFHLPPNSSYFFAGCHVRHLNSIPIFDGKINKIESSKNPYCFVFVRW